MPKKKGRGASVKTYLAFIPAVVLVAFIVYLVATPPSPSLTITTTTAQTSVNIGGQASSFSLNVIDGQGLKDQKFDFNPASGKLVFMDFIHEWCVHCNNMAPIIERLYTNYKEKDVVFITVAGGQNTDAQKTANYIRNHRVSWTAVFDPQLEVFRKYGVRGTPTYFIIDPNGLILVKLEGEQTYGTLAQELDKYLRHR
ncbi:MAG: TlpA disulfide reductase family protein [Candidatus Caldarchaeum sp.]